MESLYIITFFIIGTVFGSFYNVVGYRLPKNESVLNPKHSYCPNCHKKLNWYELIPVFSFLFQLGKCTKCKSKISIFYPMIELITGLLFAVSYYSFGFSYNLATALVLSSLFSIVIVSDIKYLIIPDEVTYGSAAIIAIIKFLECGVVGGLQSLASGVFLFLVMYGIMLLGNYMFKKESLGGADIKLMLAAGLALGPILGIVVIFVASVIALPISIIIYLVDKDNVIPFGPFIVLAILLLFLLKIDVDLLKNLFIAS